MLTDTNCSFGLVDGRPVFVDLDDDSYFVLEPIEEEQFLKSLQLPGGDGQTRPAAAGVDRPDKPAPTSVACMRPSATALQLPGCSRGAIADALTIWRLLLQVRWSLRSRPIASVLGAIARTGTFKAVLGQADAMAAACRFAQARPLVPVARNCLADSLALLRWLVAHEQGATLVLGVKLDPFAAHCWVQTDELLLNDHADRVERFTPVRTVQCAAATR